MKPGYFVIVDPDKGEIKETRRRAVPGDAEANRRIQAALAAKMGEGCYVEFVADE